MKNEETLQALRTMAWERAKGELKSMLHTYYNDSKHSEIKSEIIDFIGKVEYNGLHE